MGAARTEQHVGEYSPIGGLGVHLCTMTEDQRPYAEALRAWLRRQGHSVSNTERMPIERKLAAARISDVCIALLGPTFGAGDRLSLFSDAELEAAAAADAQPGKLLVFAQPGVDTPTSPEQAEFIDRLRNFAGGTFQATAETPDDLVWQVRDALAVWKRPAPRALPRAVEPPPNAVMISSTGDLVAERDTVYDALRSREYPIIDYLRAVSETVPPIERITAWAGGCQALMLILGTRYGYVSPIDGLGVTELEFVTALRAGRPILAFLRADAESSPDPDERQFAERVRAFVPAGQVFAFGDLDTLRGRVADALDLLRAGRATPCHPAVAPETARRWYRRQIQRWLGRLPHLTRPEGMPLEEMYISLSEPEDTQRSGRPSPASQASQASQAFASSSERAAFRQTRTVDEMLARHPRLVICGDPGAGKSVALRWYALRAPEDVTPVLVRLAAYARQRASGQSSGLFDSMEQEERRLVLAPDDTRSGWREALDGGHGLVLLDGFDEVPAAQQPLVASDILGLAAAVPPSTKIVVSTRIAGYNAQLDAVFTVADVAPLDPEQQRRLVLQWLRHAHGDSAAEQRVVDERTARLMQALVANRQLGALAGTPLLLSFLAVLADSPETYGQRMPTSKAVIYRRILRLVLGRWRTLKQDQGGWHLREKERLLVGLAQYGLLQGHGEIVTRSEIDALWARLSTGPESISPADLTRELSERDGALHRLGEDDYTLLHPTVQEYLAAVLLAALPPEARAVTAATRRLGARFEEMTQLLVSELDRQGRHQDADHLIATLAQADEQPVASGNAFDTTHRSLARAARCWGTREVEQTRGPLGAELATRLLELCRAWRADESRRYEYLVTLQAYLGLGLALVPHLEDVIALSRAEEIGVRGPALFALRMLAAAGVPGAAEAARDAEERMGVALSSAPSVDDLRGMLASPRVDARRYAAATLNRIGTGAAAAVPELAAALEDDDLQVPMLAAMALGGVGPAAASAAPDLMRLYTSLDPTRRENLSLFHAVPAALGAIGLAALPISDALLDLALHRPPSPLGSMIDERALSQIGLTPAGREMLTRALASDTDPALVERARRIQMLTQSIATAEWQDLLARELAEPRYQLRKTDVAPVLKALPPNELAAALDEIRHALRSADNPDRQYNAMVVVYGLGPAGAPAVPELLSLLRSPDVTLRATAVSALGCVGPGASAAVNDLRALLHYPQAYLRGRAATTLGHIGSAAHTATPELIALLDDAEESIRRMAVSALAGIAVAGPGNAPLVAALRRLLFDEDAEMRKNAAYALDKLGADAVTALPDLIRALDDENEQVRWMAATALRSMLPAVEHADYVPPDDSTLVGVGPLAGAHESGSATD